MSLNNFNYLVSWSDFTRVSARPTNEDEDAYIHTRMHLSYQMGGRGRSTIISSAEVNVLIVTSDCWVVSSEANDELLRHEQGHFDIQALVAREFYNQVIALTAATDRAMQRLISQLQTRLEQSTASVNERYDTVTNHKLNVAVQRTWDQRIEAAKLNPNGLVTDLP